MNRTEPILTLLTLLALLALASNTVAAVEKEIPEKETVTEATEEQAEKAATTEKATGQSRPDEQPASAAPGPTAGSLKNPDPGEAFRNFRPSEEIEAGKAVAFPVDI